MITGVQLIENLLKVAGPLPQKKLQKLAYLAEIRHIETFGERLSDLTFERYYYGPYSFDIRNIEDEDENIRSSYDIDPINASQTAELLNPDDVQPLHGDLDKHLKDIVSYYGKKTGKELEEIADQTEPFLETEKLREKIELDDFAWYYSKVNSDETWKRVEEKDKDNERNGVYGKVLI